MNNHQDHEVLEEQLRQIAASKASSDLYSRLQKKATWNKTGTPWLSLIGATILLCLLIAALFLQPTSNVVKISRETPESSLPAPLPIAAKPNPQNGFRLSEIISPIGREMWVRQAVFSQAFDGGNAGERFGKLYDV